VPCCFDDVVLCCARGGGGGTGEKGGKSPRHSQDILPRRTHSPTPACLFVYFPLTQEVREMATCIISMRSLLRTRLEELGSVHSWAHVTDQIGALGCVRCVCVRC
jgi:hypothetical protein